MKKLFCDSCGEPVKDGYYEVRCEKFCLVGGPYQPKKAIKDVCPDCMKKSGIIKELEG